MDRYILMADGSLRAPGTWEYLFTRSIACTGKEGRCKDPIAESAIKSKLVAEDPASPEGMYVLLPRGAIMAALISEHVRRFHASENAFPLLSPALARYSIDAVRSHAELSGEGIYHCSHEGQDYILRHGTLFTQFALCAGEVLHAKTLPLRMFEISPCFRHEAVKKIAPLRRSRFFNMVDMHVICCDLEQAKDECLRLHKKVHNHAEQFFQNLHSIYTIDETFWNTNKGWIKELAICEKAPVLLRKADPKKQRPINIEYHIIGTAGAIEISALQIDCCNPARFGMRMDNGKIPSALHLSIIGSLERWIYALVLEAEEKKKWSHTWLAPEQVRIIPSVNLSLEAADKLAIDLRTSGLRVTIDDRNLTIDKKKLGAEQSFTPYIFTDEITEHKKVLLHKIKMETKNMPEYPASFPVRLSLWPESFCV